ncbi:homocysteine S-methyltransferase [Rothia kristinae]|uniref:Homocysteine S-methyltransferase n=1 Tax=Rothia kristinae TaxID=37923 RepID=A0A7T3CKB1_9MICC|nr:homocysteine S-methyltransferase [Rothia kristinae]QPT54483.1 homocysteine S-methyltransferase [Rothia kristinae]SQC36942.1 Homocysteine S-methyltransferase [Rothia kristinae]
MPRQPFPTALAQASAPLILDGAMATELEGLGVDTSTPLWSATALAEHPEAVRAVHEAYYRAGAQVATTNTYQANIPAFTAAGWSASEADALLQRAVTLTREARDAAASDGWVAGSVGPYGAYLADGSEYTGRYQLSEEEFRDFHRPRLRALLGAGAEALALETMPHVGEVRALVRQLAQEFPDARAWVSLSVRQASGVEAEADDGCGADETGSDGGPASVPGDGGTGADDDAAPVLCDGTALPEVAALLEESPQVVAVGVNCLPIPRVAPALRALRRGTAKPLVAYPNSGERYDPVTKSWEPAPGPASPADAAAGWAASGARLIGGCCRTTPSDIRRIRAALTHP